MCTSTDSRLESESDETQRHAAKTTQPFMYAAPYCCHDRVQKRHQRPRPAHVRGRLHSFSHYSAVRLSPILVSQKIHTTVKDLRSGRQGLRMKKMSQCRATLHN